MSEYETMPQMRTKDAPERPVFVFDRECPLCRLAARRWKKTTADFVEYLAHQDLSGRFSDIPYSVFESQPVLVLPDGRLCLRAEAVVRTWAANPRRGRAARLYDRLPGFAAIAEAAYWLVSRCRDCSYKYARVLWREKE